MLKKGMPKGPAFRAALAMAYVAAVLVMDALWFNGRIMFHGADLFKLTAWFIIPFAVCIPRMDWAYFGFKRWRRIDYYLLGGLVAAGLVAVLAIPLFPGLRGALPSVGFLHNMVWTFSWLLGWEFLHRYLLLRRLGECWPRFGWLLIPVFEGAYHLTWWPALAMPAAMVAFSLVVTPWALRRQNTLLPFLAHLAVELELSAFLVLQG